MIIAVDGPAAAGKGTLAKRLASAFNLAYLDTGALYRATALAVLKSGALPSDEAAAERASARLDLNLLTDPNLRAEETGDAASQVAAMPAVRANLLTFQKDFAQDPPGNTVGAVLDGRDIGTVVCPDADLKLFVTASAEERAKRRFRDEHARAGTADFEAILADVKARDARDMSRKDAPLRPADDAHLLDTTLLDIEAAFDQAASLIEEILKIRRVQ